MDFFLLYIIFTKKIIENVSHLLYNMQYDNYYQLRRDNAYESI